MKRFFNNLTYMLAVLCLVISCALTDYTAYATIINEENSPESDTPYSSMSGDEAIGYFEQAVGLVNTNYKFDTSESELYKSALDNILRNNPELLEEAFSGMFNNLDKYSTYYTDEQFNKFIDNMNREFCGIGVLVMTVDEGLLVSAVYDNTPAKEAGLIPGDVIIKVGETPLAGMDISIAQGYILGEENTFVRLTVSRNGNIFEINPQRRKVVVDSGFFQSIENDSIGYIFLSEFSNNACEFIQNALNDFDSKNIENLIIDLRNNPGGSLTELVDICSLFIPEGPAIHLEFKNPLRNYTLYSDNKQVKYNLIVLINENSASASEAFSAAIQDTKTGIVLGKKSYGKGTMQNLTPFIIGGGIKLTEAEYLSPNKRNINNIGVKPDLTVTDKSTSYENADFEKITYERKLKNGDCGKDVLAVEQRLYYLGFMMELPDDKFDIKTQNAVRSFQKMNELYEYGVADITTQLKLEGLLKGSEIINDSTLSKAIDIFKNDNWKDYQHDWSIEQEQTAN